MRAVLRLATQALAGEVGEDFFSFGEERIPRDFLDGGYTSERARVEREVDRIEREVDL
jgi:hypothetical protein